MTAKPADRLLLGALRHSAPRASAVLLLTTGGAAVGLALPATLGHTLDLLLDGRPAQSWLLACAGLTALLVLLGALDGLLTGTTDARATAWLRRRALRGVLAAGPTATERHETGDLVARVVGNAATAGTAPTALAATAAMALTPVGALVALALVDPWTAATFVLGLPLLALLMRAFVRDTGDCVAQYQRIQGDIAGRLLEAIGGARTIAAAGSHEREAGRILSPLPALSRQGHRMWRVQGRSTAQAAALVPLLQIAVLAVGGLRLLAGALTIGDLLAAARYAVLAAGVGTLVGHLNGLVHSRAAARRLTELQDLPAIEYGESEATGASAAPAGTAEGAGASGTGAGEPGAGAAAGGEEGAGACTGALELRGITVRKAGHLVLDSLDLTVPGGCTMAVVGRSGTGKSVLAAVAGRLIEPDTGEVLLDGEPLRGLSHYALRRSVGYAFERPALLGGTVHDTIAYGVYEPGPGDVEAAAHAAGAASFIRRLPEGYATPCADVPLSGGEIQRLGLARAFAHAERLLILDDATSSLDTVTELRVGRALLRDVRAGTRLIIAHRAATAARADLVAWLDAGFIRALAPHATLWEDPRYRALFGQDEPAPLAEEGGPAPRRWQIPVAGDGTAEQDRTTARLPVRKRPADGPAVGRPTAGGPGSRPRRAIGHGAAAQGEESGPGTPGGIPSGVSTPGGGPAGGGPAGDGALRGGRPVDRGARGGSSGGDFPGRGARRIGGPAGARPADARSEGPTPVDAQRPPSSPGAANVPSWAHGQGPADGPTQAPEGRPGPAGRPVPGGWPVPEGIPIPEGMPVTQRRRRALADLLAQTEPQTRPQSQSQQQSQQQPSVPDPRSSAAGPRPSGTGPRPSGDGPAPAPRRALRSGPGVTAPGHDATASGPVSPFGPTAPRPATPATSASPAAPASAVPDPRVGRPTAPGREPTGPATPGPEGAAPAPPAAEAPGSVAPGSVAPGPQASVPQVNGPQTSGPTPPGPTASGLTPPGPTPSGLTPPGSTPSGLTPPGSTPPGPAPSGPQQVGPAVPGRQVAGPQRGGPGARAEMTAARVVALGERWAVERRGDQ
ncbi:ATP-binding cassette domain-containing protein [Streptomyces sp. CA-132043]|uniref:ATP-binding cassette domain-containing protein n=1 Tax=Streptomyces sp. CA-132043 TaxID=3240048 RepID=UPI003D8E0068